MLNFLKSLFVRHQFSIEAKFHEGDICMWAGAIDGCDDAIVQITNCFYNYDKDTQKESILYKVTDIYKHIDYYDVEEKYLNLLATNDEMMENISPYELEIVYRDVA